MAETTRLQWSVTGYKQLTVNRTSTSEPPLSFGPVFMHNNSDFESYSDFFNHLKVKLATNDTNNMVIRTDDERAMVNAITSSFPNSKHILCTRHLKQNVNQKLTNSAVDKTERNMIIQNVLVRMVLSMLMIRYVSKKTVIK